MCSRRGHTWVGADIRSDDDRVTRMGRGCVAGHWGAAEAAEERDGSRPHVNAWFACDPHRRPPLPSPPPPHELPEPTATGG